MNARNKIALILLCSLCLLALQLKFSFAAKQKAFKTLEAMDMLSYDELLALSEDEDPSDEIEDKVEIILETAIVKQSPQNGFIKELKDKDRKYFRALQWNVERGVFVEELMDLFHGERGANATEELKDEINLLKTADILMLNEVDLGVARTDYRNIAEEIAELAGGGYIFGTEFIEVDPAYLNDENLDKAKYKGLHGNAIISKYPIISSKVLRLKACYDWYESEKEELSFIERARRLGAKVSVKEEVISEVRIGGRIALLANLKLPNDQIVTVVSTHLENKTSPECRKDQIEDILDEIEDIENPLILGGDFNSFDSDASPMTLRKVFVYKIRDFFMHSGILAKPRKHRDPTVRNVPILASNKTRKLFKEIFDFEFDDDMKFDISNDPEWSYQKSGNMSTSNERAMKGFVETFELERSFNIAKYKIDWLFVKPIMLDDQKSYFPAFGRTLRELNAQEQGKKLSDHNPITVDIII